MIGTRIYIRNDDIFKETTVYDGNGNQYVTGEIMLTKKILNCENLRESFMRHKKNEERDRNNG